MTSGSPPPPEVSRRGPHQEGPTPQAPAWDLTRGRRDPATSSPKPNRDHSRDMQLAGRGLALPAALRMRGATPRPQRPGRGRSPEAPSARAALLRAPFSQFSAAGSPRSRPAAH